jgi:hypothetical protein
MPDQLEYEERYCAYVDILGFRELVKGLSVDPTKFIALKTALDNIHRKRELAGVFWDIRTQNISDAIAISSEVTAEGLEGVFETLTNLAVDLLCEGFFVRGAVVRGLLYHDDKTVFGEALVKAYEIESLIARYPRIVVTREVREDMLQYVADPNAKKHVKID